MGKLACTFEPGFVRALPSEREFFFDSLRDVFTEGNSPGRWRWLWPCGRSGLESPGWSSQCQYPIFMGMRLCLARGGEENEQRPSGCDFRSSSVYWRRRSLCWRSFLTQFADPNLNSGWLILFPCSGSGLQGTDLAAAHQFRLRGLRPGNCRAGCLRVDRRLSPVPENARVVFVWPSSAAGQVSLEC